MKNEKSRKFRKKHIRARLRMNTATMTIIRQNSKIPNLFISTQNWARKVAIESF